MGRLAEALSGGLNPYLIIEGPMLHIPGDERFKAPPPAKVTVGKWNSFTGTVTYDDGRIERSAVVGAAVTSKQRREEAATLKAPETPKPQQEPRPAREAKPARNPDEGRGSRFDLVNDPRRQQVIDLYRDGKRGREIARLAHMARDNVSAIIKNAEEAGQIGDRNLETLVGQSGGFKLTSGMVLDIYRSTEPIAELARRYHMGELAIRNIKHGRTWASITGAAPNPRKPGRPRGEKARRIRGTRFIEVMKQGGSFTSDQVAEALKIHPGEARKMLALLTREGTIAREWAPVGNTMAYVYRLNQQGTAAD